MDYSWIKPGAKAEIIKCKHHPELIGRIVTVSSGHKMFESKADGSRWLGVDIEEGEDFDLMHDGYISVVSPRLEYLKPVKDTPDWMAIADQNAEKCPDFSENICEAREQ